MKNITYLLLCLAASCVFAVPGRAVAIGFYPGLDKLVETADTIAIIRVEDAPSGGMTDGWTLRNCYVYQTLKGDLKTTNYGRVKIMLNEFMSVKSNFGGEGLAPMTSHLVFLSSSKASVNGANHTIVTYEGADLPLSPLGNEKKPQGKTLKAQIQTLIRRYKTYRDEQIKRENELLDKSLAE